MGFRVYHVGLEVSQAFYYAEEDCYERVFPDGNQEKWQDKKKKKKTGNMEFREMVVIILWLCLSNIDKICSVQSRK